MKMIQNKNLIQKISLILLMILCFNFVCPVRVHADTFDETVGGILLYPIMNLLLGIGDVIVEMEHDLVLDNTVKGEDIDNTTLIQIDYGSEVWRWAKAILFGVLATAIIVGVTVLTAGAGAALLGAGFTAAMASAIGGVAVFAVGAGVMVGVSTYSAEALGNKYFLPAYTLSPEEIFQNKIPLFNVNFFDPNSNNDNYFKASTDPYEIGPLVGVAMYQNGYPYYTKEYRYDSGENMIYELEWTYKEKKYKGKIIADKETEQVNYIEIFQGDNVIIQSTVSSENINSVQDKILETGMIIDFILDIDGLPMTAPNTVEWDDKNGNHYIVEKEENGKHKMTVERHYLNIGSELQPVISGWYIRIRNLALVISMSILVYVGIRMMLTSIAAEKAKYKNMLFDWLIGICLMFVMHYMMVFMVNFAEIVIDLLDTKSMIHISLIEIDKNHKSNITNAIGDKYFLQNADGTLQRNKDGNYYLQWQTNLMGMVRMQTQLNRGKTLSFLGYVLVFLILVFYTIFFIFTYLKRVLYMAFLTMIAPMVAMTYPIDKISDGKAQAFNMWFKEYLFNLLIQPFHLLLYGVLISSAMELAQTSVLYALAALGFLIPAEKLLRKFFGFEKAQTPGFLGGAAGAALTMSAVGSLNKFAKGGSSHGGEGKSSSDNKINYSRQKLPGNSFSMDEISAGNKVRKETTDKSQSKALRTTNNATATVGMGKSTLDNNGSGFKGSSSSSRRSDSAGARKLPDIPVYEEGKVPEGATGSFATYREKSDDQPRLNAGSSSALVPRSSSDLDFIEEEQDGFRLNSPDMGEAENIDDYDGPIFETTWTDKSDLVDDTLGDAADIDNDSMSLDDELRSRGIGEELEAAFDETMPEIKQQKELEKENKRAERKARRKAYARTMGYYAGESFKKSASKALMNAPSKLLRGASRFTGAGILGAIGLAAGIASGDPNNILKMGGAGLATGSAVGAGLANRAGVNNLGKPDYEKAEELERAAYGDKEYIRRKNKRLDKQFLNNPGSRNLYRGKFSGFNEEEVTAVMQRALEYKNKGLTDDKTIIELIKKEQERHGSRGKEFITGKDKRIDGYVQGLAGLVKDIKSPKDIDRVADGLDRNQDLSDAHKERIIQDLYDITGFKRVK